MDETKNTQNCVLFRNMRRKNIPMPLIGGQTAAINTQYQFAFSLKTFKSLN